MWKIKPGNEEKFRQTWLKLKDMASKLENAPVFAKLIKNTQDPTLLYSFAAWNRMEDIERLRDNPESTNIFQELTSLCTETTPVASYMVIEEIYIGQKEYTGKQH
ncbi:MAG: hypothetical protein EHM58_13980 [Ignavibacteriae bacterium]|nr:MAG: hypothetical protein EHM58_13980 [Ignavibacteriota bacterium]